MKCPRCGNELQPDEAFCGQCGTPSASLPAPIEAGNPPVRPSGALPTANEVGTPLTPPRPGSSPNPPSHSGIPGSTLNIRAQVARLPMQPPSSPGGAATPGPIIGGTPGAPQPTGFYRDATETITLQPPLSDQGGHIQSGLLGPNAQGNNAVGGASPYRSNPQQTPYGQAQGYPTPKPALPPQTQQNGATVMVIALCVAVALICIVGFVVYLNNHTNTPPTGTVNISTATAAVKPTATPLPTPTPTIAPTPTPTIVPTPAPDTGFLWCGPECSAYGFVEEYPQGWQLSATPANNGMQFANPGQPDEVASFMALGTTANTASTILTNQIQADYATKPGYTAPTGTSASTIGGETWITALLYYQSPTNPALRERVIIFATVFNGKGYVIELQAPDPLFDSINATYFGYMLSKYSFLQ